MKPFAFALLSLMLAAVVWAAPPADLAQRVEAARTQIGVPGMAIAIVEDDRVTFVKGFGVKALGKPDRVGAGDQELLDEHDELGCTAAPAGGLAVSANDMARWLLIQLDGGKLPGGSGQLFSQAAHAQMWQPVVVQPIAERPPAVRATQPSFSNYALGWDLEDYRGMARSSVD